MSLTIYSVPLIYGQLITCSKTLPNEAVAMRQQKQPQIQHIAPSVAPAWLRGRPDRSGVSTGAGRGGGVVQPAASTCSATRCGERDPAGRRGLPHTVIGLIRPADRSPVLCAVAVRKTDHPPSPPADINECVVYGKPCGDYAICKNTVPGYSCRCPQGYQANPTPAVACEQVSYGGKRHLGHNGTLNSSKLSELFGVKE